MTSGKPYPHEVIDCLYGAALDAAQWPLAMGRLVDLFGAFGASLEVHDRQTGDLICFQGTKLPDDAIVRYERHYGSVCPRVPRLVRASEGEIDFDYNFCTERDMDRSEFYSDFLAPLGLRYYMAGKLIGDQAVSSVLAIHRTRRQGHVDEQEIQLFQRSMPHIRRALDIAIRLGGAETHHRELRETLDRLTIGAVLVDCRGHVVFLNRHAERLLARSSALFVCRGRLVAARPAERAAFDRLLAEAASTSTGNGSGAGGAMLLGATKESPALSVLVTPLARRAPSLAEMMAGRHAPAAVLVFLTHLGRPDHVRTGRLVGLFGLTAAEALLASALLDGMTLKQHAEKQRISVNTTRTHLTHLREKVGAPSQAELIRRLLLALAPVD